MIGKIKKAMEVHSVDLLGFLKDKVNEDRYEVHPYAYMNNTFKYLYCFGLGVLSCGHMKAMTETTKDFRLLLERIRLHKNYHEKIIVDINNNFNYKINDVFAILDTKDKQYTFLADLFKLSAHSLWSMSYCEQVRDVYMNIFELEKEERVFFEEFMNASEKKNIELARKRYEEFQKKGYIVRYQLLKYMYPEFLLEEKYTDILLENGEHFLIDKQATIHGNIVVTNGSSLEIDGSIFKINGSITVDGARIRIKKSDLFVLSSTKNNLINITNSAVVIIDDCTIDCNYNCGIVEQNCGQLLINNSKLLHTDKEYAILFSGQSLMMNGVTMENCLCGGIRIFQEATWYIDDCRFYHMFAQHGGAIFSDSLYDGTVSNSNFIDCKAKYIGGAIYFNYKKYGQSIFGCEFKKCMPFDSIIFNDYTATDCIFHEESVD